MIVTILVTFACIVTITKVIIKSYRRNANLIILAKLFSSMSMTMCEIHEREKVIKLAENSFQPHEMLYL